LKALQKLTNGCVVAIALATAVDLSTFHSTTIVRLVFGAFCLVILFCIRKTFIGWQVKSLFYKAWCFSGAKAYI